MTRAVPAICALVACAACWSEASLGDHQPQRAPLGEAASANERPREQATQAQAGAEPPPIIEPIRGETETETETETDSAAPAEEEHAPPPVEEDPPLACQEESDNACFRCELEACCEPRLTCLESESCRCHRECRGTDTPEACHETCGTLDDRYEPWLLCVQQHCLDACGD